MSFIACSPLSDYILIYSSIVLNPSAPFYAELTALFRSSYHNDLFIGDAAQLDINSGDLLRRIARINSSASTLVDYFYGLSCDENSVVRRVYYPSKCWSIENYRARMRPSTQEFESGYGGLFTVEFKSVKVAAAFFDASNVHKGPSFGANVTLLQPYVQTVFFNKKVWAAKNGISESIIRVSVGLEEEEDLLECFRTAVREADNVMKSGLEDEQSSC